jgi:hypothetical protein
MRRALRANFGRQCKGVSETGQSLAGYLASSIRFVPEIHSMAERFWVRAPPQLDTATALVSIVGSQKPSSTGFVAAIHLETLMLKKSTGRPHIGGKLIQSQLKFLRPLG